MAFVKLIIDIQQGHFRIIHYVYYELEYSF